MTFDLMTEVCRESVITCAVMNGLECVGEDLK